MPWDLCLMNLTHFEFTVEVGVTNFPLMSRNINLPLLLPNMKQSELFHLTASNLWRLVMPIKCGATALLLFPSSSSAFRACPLHIPSDFRFVILRQQLSCNAGSRNLLSAHRQCYGTVFASNTVAFATFNHLPQCHRTWTTIPECLCYSFLT